MDSSNTYGRLNTFYGRDTTTRLFRDMTKVPSLPSRLEKV